MIGHSGRETSYVQYKSATESLERQMQQQQTDIGETNNSLTYETEMPRPRRRKFSRSLSCCVQLKRKNLLNVRKDTNSSIYQICHASPHKTKMPYLSEGFLSSSENLLAKGKKGAVKIKRGQTENINLLE